MDFGIHERHVSTRTVPLGIPLRSASLWSQNGKEERRESEREVEIQRWQEMSSYGSVFASAVLEGENEQEERSATMGDSSSLSV